MTDTPERDVNIPGALPAQDKVTEGHVHRMHDADVMKGLVVENKYDMVNNSDSDVEEDSDEENKNADEDEKPPLVTDKHANVGFAVLNTIFGMILVVMMNLPGTDSGPEIAVVIFIGAFMALTSSISFVWYLTCYMDQQPFNDQISLYKEKLEESDPEFRKKMKRGWVVQDKRWIEDMDEYINDLVMEENASMRKEDERSFKNAQHNREFSMGGASMAGVNMSDDEQIIDDDDPGETITRPGESSPTSPNDPGHGTYASLEAAGSARSDPTRSPDPPAVVEMTKIIVPTDPIKTPNMEENEHDPSRHKSILKVSSNRDSIEPPEKKRSQVSFATKEALFKDDETAAAYQRMADAAEDDEEYQPDYSTGETDEEDIIDDDRSDKTPQALSSDSEDPEPAYDPNQAPDNFYEVLFSAAHLKVTFRKYKDPVKTKVPNGFDLDDMDERELGDIIPSRLIRKRIIAEASKLIMNIRDQRSRHGDPTVYHERQKSQGLRALDRKKSVQKMTAFWEEGASVPEKKRSRFPQQAAQAPNDTDEEDEEFGDTFLGAPSDANDEDEDTENSKVQ